MINENIFTTANAHINAPRTYAYYIAKEAETYRTVTKAEREKYIARSIKLANYVLNTSYWDYIDIYEYEELRLKGYSPKEAVNKVMRG